MKIYRLILLIGAVFIGIGSGYAAMRLTSKPAPPGRMGGSTPTLASSSLPATATATPTRVASALKIPLTASDGVGLTGTYYPPASSTTGAPALLLLHAAYKDSGVWRSLVKPATEAGYALLLLDLRGHGQSGGEKTFDESMDRDVEAALAWLKTAPLVDGGRIGILGESLGANLALRAGSRHANVRAVILLSPGFSLWDLGITEAAGDYGARPMLLAAAEGDEYPAGTVQSLAEQAKEQARLQLYPGAEHGSELMQAYPDLIPLMLDWLRETIPP